MIIKPDVIVCWPRNCDYPLWRQFIHDNRDRFNVVIIVFTETNSGEDYREFVKHAMVDDWTLFADSPQILPGQDWRNVAVNHALIQSYNAEWIWFTEQDFIITNPEVFWARFQYEAECGAGAIGVLEGSRLHPCSLFVKRSVLNQTTKNFGIVPDISDHFSIFTKELGNYGKVELLSTGFMHMNGLSHNLRLMFENIEITYKPERFQAYLEECLNVTVPQDERFRMLAINYLKRVHQSVEA